MQLFSSEKIEVFLDLGSFGTEKKKRHEELKVMKITFHVALTPEVASDFVPDDGQIKAAVFSTVDADLRPFWRDSTWHLFPPAQRIEAYATPDSPEPTITFDHVRFSKVFKVKMTGSKSAVLIMHAIVSDCGPQEREAIAAWHRSQRWVTFHESNSGLDLAGDAMTEADEKAQAPHLAPMFDDPRDALPGVLTGSPLAVGAGQTGKTMATSGRGDGHRYPDTSKKRKQRRDAKARPVADVTTEDDDEQPDQVM